MDARPFFTRYTPSEYDKDMMMMIIDNDNILCYIEMTASEPLTLKEEYEMQQEWHRDDKKLTFLILNGHQYHIKMTQDEEIKAMIGDVNFFFNVHDTMTECEMEIMIAQPNCRRKGYATEAILMMMAYGMEEMGAKRIYVKIGNKNQASMKLFERYLYK